ncbi:MAG: hypothetical protein ACYCYO_10380 [Bacilli bacterium]
MSRAGRLYASPAHRLQTVPDKLQRLVVVLTRPPVRHRFLCVEDGSLLV